MRHEHLDELFHPDEPSQLFERPAPAATVGRGSARKRSKVMGTGHDGVLHVVRIADARTSVTPIAEPPGGMNGN